MDILVVPILLLVKAIVGMAVVVVVADVLIGWLVAANVINVNNHFVYSIINAISILSEFMLGHIKRRVPTIIGTIDISPVILILFLTFFENVINRVLIKL
ncbi:MAG: YggT family protein [Holosporaceae bacterium]|jgi:uncharacterized protein YggT (Ycf19 family)|nr:YggT family protein [Holosporaceae bacterium]